MVHLNFISAIQVNTIEDFIPRPSVFDVITSESKLNSWTGIPSFEIFNAIVESVFRMLPHTGRKSDALKIKVLIVFIKMKSNMSFVNMAPIFYLDASTLSRNFKKFVPIIRESMKSCIYFPTKEEIQCNLPKSFKGSFANVRGILDCTEIAVEIPKCINCRMSTYSHYKGCNTVKFLVCVTPAGLISYVSDAFSGKSSDKFIFNSTKIIDLFDDNDAIMVDKGFAILNEMQERGLTLIRPTFYNGQQFEESEVIENTKVAVARVHVERAIQRITIFNILKDKIEDNILPNISDIFFISSALTNLTTPILSNDKF